MHTMLPRMPQPVAVLCSQMLPFSLAFSFSFFSIFPQHFDSSWQAPGWQAAGGKDLWPRVEWNVLTFSSNCRNWETNDSRSDWQIDWRQRHVVLSNIHSLKYATLCPVCAQCPRPWFVYPQPFERHWTSWAYTNNTHTLVPSPAEECKQSREKFNGLKQSLTRLQIFPREQFGV